jgi:drug/metabolite transporter (DMT)-like permease
MSRGALYMAGSAFGFSVMSVLVKIASETLPTGELVLARAVVTIVVSYAMLRRASIPMGGNRRGLLATRGVLGFCGLTCYYAALAHLPLADATTLQNTTPLITGLLAWWLLREPLGRTAAIALALGITGVLIVVQPTGSHLDPVGLAFAFGAIAASSFAYVTVRELSRTEHPLVIVFYFPLISLPLSIPWAVADWVTPAPSEWLLLLGIGLATQFAQVMLTMGLVAERAGRALSVGYLQIVFAMVWQTVLFDAPPSWTSIGGAALIIVGTLSVARSKGERPAPAGTSTTRPA